MPNYKLTYFDVRARGEPARMLFALAGETFDDVRYPIGAKEWAENKSDKKRFPTGQIPVLEINGKVLTQSLTINRYLARELKGGEYYGKNNVECARIDEIVDMIADIQTSIHPIFKFKEDEVDKRIAFLIENRDTGVKNFYDFFSESLQKSGGKFFVGNRITLADIVVFGLIDFLLDSGMAVKNYYEPFPLLTKFYESIKADSPLTPYLKNRKKTKF